MWLSGRCCRTEHAYPMSDGIQMKIQKGQEMLKKIKRRDGKIKRKRHMETRIYPGLLNLIGVLFTLLFDCRRGLKTLVHLIVESKELA